MNRKKIHSYILLLLLLQMACKKENMGDCFKSTGNITRSGRLINNIQHIVLEDRINLYLEQAPYYKLEIEAGKNLHEFIETSTEGNTLTIENNNKCNWIRDLKKAINVHISLPDLQSITYRGGGEIRFTNTFNPNIFTLNLYDASGSVHLNLNSSIVIVNNHEGPADVYCSGATDKVELYSNGTGRIDTRSLTAKNAKVLNANSSQILLRVSDELNAEIRGRGNIHYFGSPTVNLTKSGSGNLLAN